MSEPLSARIAALRPQSPLLPSDGDGVTWRRTTLQDAPALTELYRAIAAVDHPNYSETEEEIREDFDHSFIDMSRDSLVAVDTATGELVAFGLVVMPPVQETLVRVILFGGVRPDWRGRGLGRQLLRWQEARAFERLAASDSELPGWIMLYADERARGAESLYARFGYPPVRWWMSLERDVADPIPDLAPAEPVRIVPWRPELSDAAHLAKSDAFRDHWASQPTTLEQWQSMIGRSTFAPQHSFLAVTNSDEVVGVLLSEVNREDWDLQGFSSAYISIIGVVRAWRRKGVAPAMLATALESLRAAGLERAVLDVDSGSPTGAVSLYAGMGFTETTREVSYVREF